MDAFVLKFFSLGGEKHSNFSVLCSYLNKSTNKPQEQFHAAASRFIRLVLLQKQTPGKSLFLPTLLSVDLNVVSPTT